MFYRARRVTGIPLIPLHRLSAGLRGRGRGPFSKPNRAGGYFSAWTQGACALQRFPIELKPLRLDDTGYLRVRYGLLWLMPLRNAVGGVPGRQFFRSGARGRSQTHQGRVSAVSPPS